jgi:sulfur carrier protein
VQVIINGKPHRAPAKMTLAQAVAMLTSAPTGVAAALNGAVVRRGAWNSTSLADGDEVEVLTAVQGG